MNMHKRSNEDLLPEFEALQQKYDSLLKLYNDNIQTSKQTEQILLENEANIKAIIENSLGSVWSIDRNYNIQYVNDIFAKSFYESFGVQLVKGANLLKLLPEFLRDTWKERYDRAFNNEHFVFTDKIELENRVIYIEVAMNPVVINGKVVGASFFGKDITEKKLAENSLISSEERLKILFNYAPEAYYLCDLNGNFVDGNIAAEKLLGINKTEIIGKNLFNLNLLSKKQLLKAAKLLALNVLGQPTGPTEFTLHTNNEKKVTVEINTYPVKIEGQVLVLGIARDISERKKAEKAMKIASENWNRTFQTMHNGIALLDAEQQIIQANRSFQNFTGLNESEVKGKQFFNTVFTEVNSTKENPFEKIKLTKVCETAELLINGRICEILVDPVFDAERIITGAVAIISDVTQRKRDEDIQHILHEITGPTMFDKTIEELLLIVRQALSKVIDTNNFFVALHNPESNTLRKVIFEDEKDDFIEWDAKKSLSGQVLKNATTLLLDSEGETRFANENDIELLGSQAACWLGVPIMNKEHAIGVMVVQSYSDKNAYDLTTVRLLTLIAHELSIVIERKKMIRDILAAKEKAEESDRLKSAFLANMSHEIRTPMNGILGFADLLKQPRLTNEEQQLFISIIEKSGQRMLNIINDLINISKIESGQMEVWYTDTNINEQIEFLYNFFTPEIRQKDIKLITTCPLPFSKSVIKTDREKLYAILTNLVKNAIKFTQKGSIEFGYQATTNHVLFYIKDTGIGIPENKQKAIFERFVQVGFNRQKKHEGAGLGLSISKAYVEMLGGKIWLESEEGKGTSFYFTLPVQTKTSSIPVEKIKLSSEKASISNLNTVTLLIAEDDEISKLYLTQILKSFNFKLLFARTGLEAVEICKVNHEIELVLMDINMPEMDGHEAAKHIKSFKPNLVIFAQTAFALDEDKEQYGDIFNDYVSKPVKADELIQKIRDILHNTKTSIVKK